MRLLERLRSCMIFQEFVRVAESARTLGILAWQSRFRVGFAWEQITGPLALCGSKDPRKRRCECIFGWSTRRCPYDLGRVITSQSTRVRIAGQQSAAGHHGNKRFA